MTIALAVGLALAPRWANAADPVMPLSDDTGESPGTTAPGPGTRAAPPAIGALPDQPFAEGAAGQRDDAEAEDADADDEAPGAPLRTLSCLEGEGGNEKDGARRGVQKKDFLKKRRAEISILGGYYASDQVSSTYVYGGAVSFFLSEDFGFEALVTRHPVQFRLEEPFNSFDQQKHFQASVAWDVLAAMLWSPIHAKLRWSERHITHTDLLIVAGAGQTANGTVQGLTFEAGLGLKIYIARFFALRFDVRDFMVPQEVLGRGRNTHNLVTTFGLSAWVPG